MDHLTFAQLLGNYGEFVGAIAVVVTLVYLALQVRHSKEATDANTKAIRAQSIQAVAQSVASNVSNISSGDNMLLFRRGLGEEYESFSDEERQRFFELFFGIYLSLDSIYWLREEDSVPDGIWRRELAALGSWLKTPGGMAAWNVSRVSDEFKEYVDQSVLGS